MCLFKINHSVLRTRESMRFQPTFQCVNEVCETLLGKQENIPKDVFFLIWNSISYEERVIRDEESTEFVFADFETRGSSKRHKKGIQVALDRL